MNEYDNDPYTDQAWTGVGSKTRRKARADTDKSSIIGERVIILGTSSPTAGSGTYTVERDKMQQASRL